MGEARNPPQAKISEKLPLECHFCTILDLNLKLVWNQGINPRNQEPAAGEKFRKKCFLSAISALFWTSICNWSGTKEFSRVGKPGACRWQIFQKNCLLSAILALFWTSTCNWSGTKELTQEARSPLQAKISEKSDSWVPFLHYFGPQFAIGLEPRNQPKKPGARRRRKFQKKVLLECHFCTIFDLNLQLV